MSSRLTAGAEALKTSGDMRSMNLRQSISGALQRVGGMRSPGKGPEPGKCSPTSRLQYHGLQPVMHKRGKSSIGLSVSCTNRSVMPAIRWHEAAAVFFQRGLLGTYMPVYR